MSGISKKTADERLSLIHDIRGRSSNLTFSQACDMNASELPDRAALIDKDRRLNWLEVKHESDQLARAMIERGVMRPDIALIHLSNSAEQFLIRLACEKAGIRVILTNSAYRETELASIIERARPCLAFISAGRATRGEYDRLREVLGRSVGRWRPTVGQDLAP